MPALGVTLKQRSREGVVPRAVASRPTHLLPVIGLQRP
jgi:hypothetical protein